MRPTPPENAGSNPGYASARQRYALLPADLTRFDEAIGEIQRAYELESSPLTGTLDMTLILKAGICGIMIMPVISIR